MAESVELEVKGLDFHYAGNIHALKKINFTVYKNTVTALIGITAGAKLMGFRLLGFHEYGCDAEAQASRGIHGHPARTAAHETTDSHDVLE